MIANFGPDPIYFCMRKYEPKTALVIVNSTLPADPILKECQSRSHVILCADGGANQAYERHVKPDLIIGDMDSILPEVRTAFNGHAREIILPGQDKTDLEKALQYAKDMKVERVILMGVTGMRLDHQLFNLHVAQQFCYFMEIEVQDNYGVGYFITPTNKDYVPQFNLRIGQQISLLAFEKVEGVLTHGLKYPLINEPLEWSVRNSQSNEVIASPVSIRLRRGVVFMYCVRENIHHQPSRFRRPIDVFDPNSK